MLRQIDTKILDSASEMFDRNFPDAENLRHAVAHSGELHNTPEKYERHWVKSEDVRLPGLDIDPGLKVSIEEVFSNDTFVQTRQGSLVKYDLTEKSGRALIEIANMIFGAARPFLLEDTATAEASQPG